MTVIIRTTRTGDEVVSEEDGSFKVFKARKNMERIMRSPGRPDWEVRMLVADAEGGRVIYVPASRLGGRGRWTFHTDLAGFDAGLVRRAAEREVVPVVRVGVRDYSSSVNRSTSSTP